MILGAEYIQQPYSGEYVEKIYDIENPWNSSDWTWIKFFREDDVWCGVFRGKYRGVAISGKIGIVVVLTSDYLYVLDSNTAEIVEYDSQTQYIDVTTSPFEDILITDGYGIKVFTNKKIKDMNSIVIPIQPDNLRFVEWNGTVSWYGDIFLSFVKVIAAVFIFIFAGILTVVLTRPFWKKVKSFDVPQMKKVIFSKACSHLRDYYGIQEPYIITKCFDSTDKKFNNHDVCIFFVGDELRITTDLIHGFLYEERDLGCYAFKKKESVLSKQLVGENLIAELRADNTVFCLGYRAKSYIEKNFME